ncbi:hypothetical protein GKQ77_32290, partial [Streptomyces sp. BG9H]
MATTEPTRADDNADQRRYGGGADQQDSDERGTAGRSARIPRPSPAPDHADPADADPADPADVDP